MTLSTIMIFLAGIANFAMHRALVESRDPIVRAAVMPVQRAMGRHTSYGFEFVLLAVALWFGQHTGVFALLLYGLYTMVNALVFGLLTNRGG